MTSRKKETKKDEIQRYANFSKLTELNVRQNRDHLSTLKREKDEENSHIKRRSLHEELGQIRANKPSEKSDEGISNDALQVAETFLKSGMEINDS